MDNSSETPKKTPATPEEIKIQNEKTINFLASNRITDINYNLILDKLLNVRDATAIKSIMETALIKAAANGNINAVQLLLDKDVNPNAANNNTTPLMCASNKSNIEIIQLLLDAGAKINTFDERKWTALLIALSNDDIDIKVVKTLLAAGADVNCVNEENNTPLMMASMKGDKNIEVVNILLDAGADVNASALRGYTPLIAASQQNHIGMVKTLLCRKDINVNILAKERTALAAASHRGHTEIAQFLLDAGADVNDTVNINAQNFTSLQLANRSNHAITAQDIINSAIATQTNKGEDWQIFIDNFSNLVFDQPLKLTPQIELLLRVTLPEEHTLRGRLPNENSENEISENELQLQNIQEYLDNQGLSKYQQHMTLAAFLGLSANLRNTSTYLVALLSDNESLSELRTNIINSFNEENPDNHLNEAGAKMLNDVVKLPIDWEGTAEQKMTQIGNDISELLKEPKFKDPELLEALVKGVDTSLSFLEISDKNEKIKDDRAVDQVLGNPDIFNHILPFVTGSRLESSEIIKTAEILRSKNSPTVANSDQDGIEENVAEESSAASRSPSPEEFSRLSKKAKTNSSSSERE